MRPNGAAWRRRRGVLVVAGLAMAVISGRAAAALGEPAGSIAADRKALSAEARATTSHEGFSVHRLESPANAVREYVSPSGVVFALAWNGLTHPDLTTLLGSYAPEYRQAVAHRSSAPDRSRRLVKTERVVVETWGHMRSLHGRAYAPALIPPGVSIDAIR
jgi:hypothetical protein